MRRITNMACCCGSTASVGTTNSWSLIAPLTAGMPYTISGLATAGSSPCCSAIVQAQRDINNAAMAKFTSVRGV
jgi:hypothetical protein